MTPSRAVWDAYIRQFHHDRPGITDEVLRRSRHCRQTPYEWLVEGLPPCERVLDVACGDAPLRPLVGDGWIGIDASLAELHAMANPAGGSAIAGDVRSLPMRAATRDVVLCSMALMLVEPLDRALREIARVLRPGGTARLLLPARDPLTVRDRSRYLRLAVALRTASWFPPSPLRRHAGPALARAGLVIIDDATLRFGFTIASPLDARLFVESLYLPDRRSAHVESAVRVATRWVGTDLGLQLRRVIATRIR